MDEKEQQARDYGLPRKGITLFLFGLVGVFVFLTYMSLGTDKAGSFAWCLFCSAALAIFWPLVAKVDNLKIGPTGVELTRRVEEANAKADDASNKAYDALATITRFVFNSMPQPTFYNLQKISSNNFGSYNMDSGFRQQL